MMPTGAQLCIELMGEPLTTEQLARRLRCTRQEITEAIEAAADEIVGTCNGSITGKDHEPIVWHLASEVEP